MSRDRTKVILIRETFRQSAAKDAVTWAMIVSLIGIGKWIDSTVMEVFGALLAFAGIVSLTLNASEKHRLTIDEARAELDRIERERTS